MNECIFAKAIENKMHKTNSHKFKLANLTEISEAKISNLSSDILFDAAVLKTNFSSNQIGKNSILEESNSFIKKTLPLIDTICSKLKDGGLIFIYGLPNYLSYLGEYLSDKKQDEFSYIFKYWISCEFKAVQLADGLPNAHIGLLMYLKSKSKKNPTPFDINTKFVRIPYSDCISCGNMTKDWGGKKHMLNPLGSALSDVWSFKDISIKKAQKIPSELTERILALLSEGKNVLQVNQTKSKNDLLAPKVRTRKLLNGKALPLEANRIIHRNCIDFLKDLYQKYPHGVFDIAFADPPYNLAKNYSKYDDDLETRRYVDWCNEWLQGMYNNLKPGGALFVLNIPKWAIYHYNFLADKMVFQNWIVWDALSTPMGKLLPAHYSLLYFTKSGARPKVNLVNDQLIDSREYCLRNSCVKKRKKFGDNKKEKLTDIWKDIHRIKHKKDRDHHPCQLPIKLMERIIKNFCNEGDLIFDPFGGAGTTAICAKILNRNFIITEIDSHYVKIAKNNLSKIQKVNGILNYDRESLKYKKNTSVSKNEFEKRYLELTDFKRKAIEEKDLIQYDQDLLLLKEQYSGDFKKLYSIAKRRIETLEFSQAI